MWMSTHAMSTLKELESVNLDGVNLPDIELPKIPLQSGASSRQTLVTAFRKRPRGSSFADSSDPPVFSSDDATPSIENYTSKRAKRHYQGAWWQNGGAPSITQGGIKTKNRGLSRNFDSGVWMSSDPTEGTEDEHYASIAIEHRSISQEVSIPPSSALSSRTPLKQSTVICSAAKHLTLSQKEALEIVQARVDRGNEVIDLDGRELGQIPWSILSPLERLTLPPHYDLDIPPSQESYEDLTPNIQLYLARNCLSSLPGGLYALQNLTSLSLRQNDLKEILPAVSHLKRLEYLNLGMNFLSWLPWEILYISDRLRSLLIRPNPFFVPISPLISDKSPIQAVAPPIKATHMATSTIAFLDINGRPLSTSPPNPSRTSSHVPTTTPKLQQSPPNSHRVPSLFELSLRAAAPFASENVSILVESGDAPPVIVQTLQHAEIIDQAGGQICSVCGKNYIQPRTEWIEWWAGLPSQGTRLVPLLRRGCTPHCIGETGDVEWGWTGCGWKVSEDED